MQIYSINLAAVALHAHNAVKKQKQNKQKNVANKLETTFTIRVRSVYNATFILQIQSYLEYRKVCHCKCLHKRQLEYNTYSIKLQS